MSAGRKIRIGQGAMLLAVLLVIALLAPTLVGCGAQPPSATEQILEARVAELEGEKEGLKAEIEELEKDLNSCEDDVKAAESSAEAWWTQLEICNEAKVQLMNQLGITAMAQEPVTQTETSVTPTPKSTPTSMPPPVSTSSDPLIPSLATLGFSSRLELINFFSIIGVEERELATCPQEEECVRILREKDENNYIIPFMMNNPTSTTFNGWRAASGQPAGWDGNQAKVPPGGPWMVEGVTLRPWR